MKHKIGVIPFDISGDRMAVMFVTSQKRGRWMSALLAVVILFILLMVWSSILPRSINTGGLDQTATQAHQGNATNTSGVPVSADDFLRGQ